MLSTSASMDSPSNAIFGGGFDPVQSFLTAPSSGLSPIFAPKSVAVIGATDREGSVGRTTVENLIAANTINDFPIYPINPKKKTILGLKAYSCISEILGPVHMVVIITPAKTVAALMEKCGRKGVRACVIISAGFKEMGLAGLELENEVVRIARKYRIRVVGPNCLGVMRPVHGLNATFSARQALPGSVAFASQSGAMCTAVLDWALQENVGFSFFASIGSMADIDWGDLISHLGTDPNTKSILIYMETIGNANSFLSAARQVSIEKPIIVLKAGRSQAAAKAAASHTGSLAGVHDAFIAAMKRVGVMIVDSIGELFDCALALGTQPRPRGPNLLIITNAGGPGVLATDAVSLNGGALVDLSDGCIAKLNEFCPAAWSHSNPVDILGDASPELYAKTLEVALQEESVDGVLVILSPQSVTEPLNTAMVLLEAVEKMKTKNKGVLPKPVMASWMGGADTKEGFNTLVHGGVPTYLHPDSAARTFSKIWKNTMDMRNLMEIPGVDARAYVNEAALAKAIATLKIAKGQGRPLLTEAESKEIIRSFGIPVAETIICSTVEAALEAGDRVGYPCVVKLNSETITHKSDVGGVKLNIKEQDGIRASWDSIKENVDKIGPEHFQGVTVQPMIDLTRGIELLVGSIQDPQLGQLIAFGTGGCMVEVFKDTSLSIPPLNATLARRQIEDTKIYTALKGGQGDRFPGVPLDEVIRCLITFSQMIIGLREYVEEIDINPLLALPDRIVALDARFVLKAPDSPVPVVAIRPYPREYMKEIQLKNDSTVLLRPANPSDFVRLERFHRELSESTIRQRYLREVSLEERVAKQGMNFVCCADYSRLIALVAVTGDDIVGILRLSRFPTRLEMAELRITISDRVQGQGLGTSMLLHALDVARTEEMTELVAPVLKMNDGFLKMAERVGFQSRPSAVAADVLELYLRFE